MERLFLELPTTFKTQWHRRNTPARQESEIKQLYLHLNPRICIYNINFLGKFPLETSKNLKVQMKLVFLIPHKRSNHDDNGYYVDASDDDIKEKSTFSHDIKSLSSYENSSHKTKRARGTL